VLFRSPKKKRPPWYGPVHGDMGGPSNSGACFVQGTLVQTEDGLLPIEDVQKGACVLTCLRKDGVCEYDSVVRSRITVTRQLVNVWVGHERIQTTPEHPFWVASHGWSRASQLSEGDLLLTVDGEFVPILDVQNEMLTDPISVYNITVAGEHVYFVGSTGVLVHNKQ